MTSELLSLTWVTALAFAAGFVAQVLLLVELLT